MKTSRSATSLHHMIDIYRDAPSLSRSNSPTPIFALQNVEEVPSPSNLALKRRRRVSTSPEPGSSDGETSQKRKPRKRDRRSLPGSSEPSPTNTIKSTKRKRDGVLIWGGFRDRSSSNDRPLLPKRTKYIVESEFNSETDVMMEDESSATLQDEPSSESMDQPIIRTFELVSTPQRPSTFVDDSAWGMDLS